MKQIELTDTLYNKLHKAWKQTDHTTMAGFIEELFHQWDKDMAINDLQSRHIEELNELEEELNESCTLTINNMKVKYQNDLTRQRNTIGGTLIENFVPFFPEYKYNTLDIRFVGDPFDFLVLDGLSSTQQINSIIFQEIKTGATANQLHSSRERALRDFLDELDNPLIRYEHWAKKDTDKTFSVINRKRRYSHEE